MLVKTYTQKCLFVKVRSIDLGPLLMEAFCQVSHEVPIYMQSLMPDVRGLDKIIQRKGHSLPFLVFRV